MGKITIEEKIALAQEVGAEAWANHTTEEMEVAKIVDHLTGMKFPSITPGEIRNKLGDEEFHFSWKTFKKEIFGIGPADWVGFLFLVVGQFE